MIREEFVELFIGVFIVNKRHQYGADDTAHRSDKNL
jgi:hypothetical protein